LDEKGLPRDPDLMESVSEGVQGLLRERMKRGQVILGFADSVSMHAGNGRVDHSHG
jgi:hypothetical protein